MNLLLLSLLPVFAPGLEGPFQVRVYGALRDMMHAGDISAKVRLADLAGAPGLFGLGALADLKGEIMIMGGEIQVSRAEGQKVSVHPVGSEDATLLVTALVPEWQEFPIPNEISSLSDLEAFVQAAGKQAGLDPNGPYPFQVLATAKAVSWHVINWVDGDTVHTHEKHMTTGAHGELRQQKATFLGFYSDHHQGVFTHHSGQIHVHMSTLNGTLLAHVDKLALNANATLLLPRTP